MLYAADFLETGVLIHQAGGFGLVEPVAAAMAEFITKLGIDLRVIDGGEEIDGTGDVDTEVTAGTGGIHQGAAVVRGGDKRGKTAALFHVGGERETHIDLILGDEELQQGMLATAELIELIDIDQCTGGESAAAGHGRNWSYRNLGSR